MQVTWRADRSQVAEPFATNVTTCLAGVESDAACVITCGARDPAVEAAGYAAWEADHAQPKFTDPANSAHCCVPALAVDFTLVKDGKDDWDSSDPDWQAIIAAVRASPDLHPGADFGDDDHIEAVGWRRIRDASA